VPNYFFHTEDGRRLCDEDGTELPGIEAAKIEAVRFLCERLHDDPAELWDSGAWRVLVQDDRMTTLFIIDVSVITAAAFPLSALPKSKVRTGLV
jgi:hypothetical protein